MSSGKFPWLGQAPFSAQGPLPMSISAPSSRPARTPVVQPWALGLVGVVAILALLVALTI
jgi:hypothetical protein